MNVVGGDYKDQNRPYRVAAYSQDQGKTWRLASRQPGGYRSAVVSIDGATLAALGPSGAHDPATGLPTDGLSATLPQSAQPHQGFGSMPMRSLTADRIPYGQKLVRL